MEVLKRKNEIEDFKQSETDSKRTKTEMRKNDDSSDSEAEEDLLQRLFGSSKPIIQKTPELIENIEDLTNEGTGDKEKEPEEVKEEDEECVWHDEDDDQVKLNSFWSSGIRSQLV